MKKHKMQKSISVYAYTMVYDTGFAPSVSDNTLSLACCKTYLRYKIANQHPEENAIYLIGLCGKQMSDRHCFEKNYFPVYIAKITRTVKTEEYYSKSEYKLRPDVQYEYKDGQWYVLPTNPHHNVKSRKEHSKPDEEKDIYYIRSSRHEINYVLLSENEFVCFGNKYKDFDKYNSLPQVIKNICVERKNACRSDLTPIGFTSQDSIDEFLQFFHQNKKGNNQVSTIDKHFLSGGCKGEKKCR